MRERGLQEGDLCREHVQHRASRERRANGVLRLDETNDFRAHFKQDYDELAALGKPLVIAETSINFEHDADRARYVTNLLACELPYHFPKIETLVWFSQPEWGDLLDPAYPLTREAFRSGIADPYYVGR